MSYLRKPFILITSTAILLLLFDYCTAAEEQKVVNSQSADYWNILEFGAKGDGKTDDTQAIQRTLNLARKYRATVYFPEGVYRINPDKPLIVRSNVSIIGSGSESVLRADHRKFGWELVRLSGDRITVSNMTLDGNLAVNRVLVVGSNSSNVLIEGVEIANAAQSSDPKNDYHSQVVSGLYIYGNTSNIQFDRSEIRHIKAQYGLPVARGIYVTTSWHSVEKAPFRVSITNSRFHDVGPADDGDCIYVEDRNKENRNSDVSLMESVIAHNEFSACAKRAIKIFADGVEVTDNRIVNTFSSNNKYVSLSQQDVRVPDMYAGISAYGNEITIEDNTLYGVGSYYAAVEVGAALPVSGITVANNKIRMGRNSDIEGTTGIRLGNVTDFAIEGNLINHGAKAIWIWEDAHDGSITDNVISMPVGGGVDLSGLEQSMDENGITVDGNRIDAKTFKIKH